MGNKMADKGIYQKLELTAKKKERRTIVNTHTFFLAYHCQNSI